MATMAVDAAAAASGFVGLPGARREWTDGRVEAMRSARLIASHRTCAFSETLHCKQASVSSANAYTWSMTRLATANSEPATRTRK